MLQNAEVEVRTQQQRHHGRGALGDVVKGRSHEGRSLPAVRSVSLQSNCVHITPKLREYTRAYPAGCGLVESLGLC